MKKPRTLQPVRPNEGLMREYKRRLDALVDEMHASLLYWLGAAYKANKPEMAADVSPAVALRGVMARLAKRWQRKIDRLAPELARWFAQSAGSRSDAASMAALRKAGMSVKFSMTAEANDVMQATIGEQVGLIKSIAQQHLTNVEGAVMRSVSAGRDLGALASELETQYGATKKRAALIARDQNNKATATMNRVRQQSLGITEAVWMHSHAGKHPRPSHVKADGTVYKVAEGLVLDGEQVWPGSAINCRCTSRSILPGF